MTKYKKHEIIRTFTTTTVIREAFGRTYQKDVNVYEIKGKNGKSAGMRPFLTSIQQCKNYINSNL